MTTKAKGKPVARPRKKPVPSLGEWKPKTKGSIDDAPQVEITIPASIRKPPKWSPDGVSLVIGYGVGIVCVFALQAFVRMLA